VRVLSRVNYLQKASCLVEVLFKFNYVNRTPIDCLCAMIWHSLIRLVHRVLGTKFFVLRAIDALLNFESSATPCRLLRVIRNYSVICEKIILKPILPIASKGQLCYG
jgi:hypothetical protein